jgi:glycerophosphoryl diester phosphodiesterase
MAAISGGAYRGITFSHSIGCLSNPSVGPCGAGVHAKLCAVTALVIGHRGAPHAAPGNTLAAFQAAIDEGADMVECDVRRTRDGVLVIHHNATRRSAVVSRLTYEGLIRRCRHEPPTLEAVAALCAGRVGIDVEVKQRGCEEQVLDVVSRRFALQRILITSFDDEVIISVKRADARIKCGLLLGPRRLSARRASREALPFQWAEQCGAEYLVAHQLIAGRPSPRRGGAGFLAEAARRGYPVIVWTVNSAQRLGRYLWAPGVAGIITDFPGVAAGLRDRRPPVQPMPAL